MAGEFDFLQWIADRQREHHSVQLGSGDDLAVLKWPPRDLLLVGVDQLLDGIHVDSSIHSPRAIGRKAMNRNLSDCAAMACLPAAAVGTVALPRGTGVDYARELYLGMEEAAGEFDCPIVGGDTGSWSGKLAMTVTILGRSEGIEPITRRAARPGDFIYVTGPLGGSLLGRHMTFPPRVAIARKLAIQHRLTAMIDLSDGISRDLEHICRQSGVGAIIDSAQIPIHSDAVTMSKSKSIPSRSPLEHALHDGEDYELLITSPDVITCAGEFDGVRQIGVITADKSVLLRQGEITSPLKSLAWEHSL